MQSPVVVMVANTMLGSVAVGIARGRVMASGGSSMPCGETGFLPSMIGGWSPGYWGAGPVWVPSGYVAYGSRSSGCHSGGKGGEEDSGNGQERGGRSSGSCGVGREGAREDEKISMIIPKDKTHHSGRSGDGRKAAKRTKKTTKHTQAAAAVENSECRIEAKPRIHPTRQRINVKIGIRAGTAVEVNLDMSDTMRVARDKFYRLSYGEAAPDDTGHYILCEGRELKLSSTVCEGGVKESANLFLMEFTPCRAQVLKAPAGSWAVNRTC